MEIDAVNPIGAPAHQTTNPPTTNDIFEAPDPTPDPGDQTGPSQTEALSTDDEPGETEGEKGVLRLLQEGHFKGVPDVRLRINFFDELAAVKTAQVEAVADEKVAGVVESVGSVVDSFLEDNDLTQEQTAGLQLLQDSFAQAANAAHDDPVIGLKSAFADYLAALIDLFESTPDEPGPDSQAFITDLQSAFFAGMDELTEALSSVQILPGPSEPSGNGKAYEKFVAIYNEMRGVSTAGGEPVPEPTEPPE
ncbi:MAG: hypothetical protein ACYS83_09825 [Planctomycetota bacterium]|jgi:hypothetical protein